jgi:hypothetical protein
MLVHLMGYRGGVRSEWHNASAKRTETIADDSPIASSTHPTVPKTNSQSSLLQRIKVNELPSPPHTSTLTFCAPANNRSLKRRI